MRHVIFLGCMTFLVLVIFSGVLLNCVSGGTCPSGELYAWYSNDAVSWENATVDVTWLKRGEPFFIRAVVIPNTDVHAVLLRLWETGEQHTSTSSFELLQGPDCFFRFYPVYGVSRGEEVWFQWTFRVKPECSWIGTAPLNICVMFMTDDQQDDQIFFTISNIHIQQSSWEPSTQESLLSSDVDNQQYTSPIMTAVVVSFVVMVFVVVMILSKFF